MFEHLAKYERILVTGPQRSGTTIAARMIAADTGHRYIDEGAFGAHHRDIFLDFVKGAHEVVIQCPAMAYTIHETAIPGDALVVYMRRPIEEIVASQNRVEWESAEELQKWPGATPETLPEHKYALWEKQKPLITNWIEIEYHDLAEHELWIAGEERVCFGMRQWRRHNVAVVVPALDPQHVQDNLEAMMGNHGVTGTLDVLISDDHIRTQFTKAVNRGLSQMPERADYVAILSDDVRPVTDRWLDKLCSQLDTHPRFGYASPAMPCHTPFINQHEPVKNPQVKIVANCPFGCVVMKRETLDQVGPLDEWLLHYASDTDHQLRGHEQGWLSVCDQEVFVMRDVHLPTQPQWTRDRARFAKKWGIETLLGNRGPRILYVDTISLPIAQDTAQGIVNAYSKLGNVQAFDYRQIAKEWGVWEMNAALIEWALWYRPHFVHLGKCETVFGRTVKRIKEICGAYVLNIYGDVRDEVADFTVDIGRYADVTILTGADERQVQMHLDAGCRRIDRYFVGVDVDVFEPQGIEAEYDIAFMGWVDGHPFGDRRREMIQAMADAGFSVRVFGCVRPLDIAGVEDHTEVITGQDFALECGRARVVLNMCDDRWRLYTSWPRVWRTLASGGFLLTNYFPGMDEVIVPGVHCDSFRTTEEAVLKAAYYLQHPDERQQIAAQGMELAREQYNWDAVIGRLWDAAGIEVD